MPASLMIGFFPSVFESPCRERVTPIPPTAQPSVPVYAGNYIFPPFGFA